MPGAIRVKVTDYSMGGLGSAGRVVGVGTYLTIIGGPSQT